MAAWSGRLEAWLVVVVASLLLLDISCLAGADNSTAREAPYDCQAGCRKVFKPICGADGRTYSHPCLATCQGVKVAQHGPCPGERVLHPDNVHVVTSVEPEHGSTILSPEHLSAFAHEGYRYTGQLTFTGEVVKQRHGRRSGESGSSSSSDGQQQQPARAMRITREGHVYVAGLDETVQAVLDAIIQRNANSSQQQEPHVHALIHNLRQWREYRGASGSDAAGERASRGGAASSKWKRHSTVAEGMGEHTLIPVQDAMGAASTASALKPQGAGSAAQQQQEEPTATSQDNLQKKGPSAGKQPWSLWGQRRRLAEQPADNAAAEGGSRHRQARRSLGIFDTDDRLDCPRTPTYPFTAVGQINVRDSSGNYVCSGALVGPDVVLTAAHCVFNRGAQTFYDKLDFAPARYRTLDGEVVNPFGVVPWSYVTVYQSYSTLATADPNIFDVAVIKLSQRIGSQAGWMGVFEPCSAFAPSRYVALTAGYPSDQAPGSCKSTQCVVVQEPCTDSYLYHKCDTASGQSGSPMWMMAMTSQRKMGPYVRAVHNIEWVQEMPNGQSVSYINSAVSITPDHYRSILAWIAPSFDSTSSSSSPGADGTTPMGPALPPRNSNVDDNSSSQYSTGR